jgi:hypothetical protein
MKKEIVIVIILSLLIVGLLISQEIERISQKLPVVSNTKSKILNVVKWSYSEEGQWEIWGRSNDFELKEIEINNKKYIILIFWYDVISRYYETLNSCKYYVFDKKYLENILPDDIKFNESDCIDIKVLYFDRYEDLDDWNINASNIGNKISKKIKRDINNESINSSVPKLKFFGFPVIYKGNKLMRFLFEEYSESWYDNNKTKNTTIFNEKYYEIDFNEFKNFIHY